MGSGNRYCKVRVGAPVGSGPAVKDGGIGAGAGIACESSGSNPGWALG